MSTPHDKKQKTIAEQAAEWVIRYDEGDLNPSDSGELMHWLILSPIHIDEFLLASVMWDDLGELANASKKDIEQLVAVARQNVTPIDQAGTELPKQSQPAHPRTFPVWLAATAATVLLAVGVAFSLYQPTDHFATGLGEQLTVSLDDGSTVYMNTLSELTVTFSAAERKVEILSGEALFEVAKDPDRPFSVNSGAVTARALGTLFNVQKYDKTTEVTVVEGRVTVLPRSRLESSEALNGPLELNLQRSDIFSAGEQASADAVGTVRRVESPNMEKTLAWRDQRLIFVAEPLARITADFNRYNREKMKVVGEKLQNRILTATFNANEPESLLQFLEKDPKIEVVRRGNEVLIKPAVNP